MKILKWLGLTVASGLLFVSSADAAEVDVSLSGVGDTADSYFVQTNTGTITDYINLTLGASDLTLEAYFGGFYAAEFDQANSTWALYLDDGNDLDAGGNDTWIASGNLFTDGFIDTLDSGDYYFVLVSEVVATNGGEARTDYQLTLTSVPLPAAFWLFGSALIGFVGFGRHRSASA